jgi:hypothetical protein
MLTAHTSVTCPERSAIVTTQQAESLIAVHNLEYPRSVTRRIKAGLTLAGVAAASVLALMATSPAAQADTADIPSLPAPIGDEISPESLGISPFFGGEAFEQDGTYTDLLGFTTTTGDGVQDPPLPLQWTEYSLPAGGNPSFVALGVTDPNGYDLEVQGANLNGDIGGSDFSYVATGSGFYNLYEDTPYYAGGSANAVDSINDTFVFDPTGSPLAGLAGIEFGIQYIDLPDAATPIDAINVLGSGGEILFSIPVTGDLLAGL